VVFLIVRVIESMQRKDACAAEAAPAPDPQEQLALAASRLADALERRQLCVSPPGWGWGFSAPPATCGFAG
jgi:hypothetical protein